MSILVTNNTNGNKVSPKSECYEESLSGYHRLYHTDIYTFTLVFNHWNKSRAGQIGPVTRVSCILYIINEIITY